MGHYATVAALAEESCRVEIDICREPIGKLDQYEVALGGFNLIEFQQHGRVDVTPIVLPAERRQQFERRIIAFYTGVTRSASALLKVQSQAVASDTYQQLLLHHMVELAYLIKAAIATALGSLRRMRLGFEPPRTGSLSTTFESPGFPLAMASLARTRR